MTAQPRRFSLQTRLLLLVLGFATTVWLCAAAFTWIDAQGELDELLDGHLAQAASLLMVQADGDLDDIFDTPVLHKYAPQVAFQVFLGNQLMTHSNNAGVEPLSGQMNGFSNVQRGGVLWRVVTIHNAKLNLTVLVGEKLESRRAIMWALMRSLVGPLLIALPLFGMGLWWSIRRGLAPLRTLRETLETRAPLAAQPVELVGMPRELQPLVQTLNDLLARIDRMVQIERRFTADAAHELRTPIAAIRAQAQVAMGAGDDVAERTHALQTTLAGCDRASRLVDQLLTLARLETAPAVQADAVDLRAVVRRVAAELAPAALARQQDIVVHAEGPCPVAANELLLGVLVRNLVDNGLRYSPAGAQVEVTVDLDDAGPVLTVQDSGRGMSEAEIAHLGERFFRVLGTEQPGSGLGWSIVRRLLDVFGAQVAIGRSAALGGLAVTVRWPAVPPKP
ncbi:two-component sensor histidine kinase [Rhodoferax lacus]|uniref:histidine kinase n=1 Tax=Rhodoferax lacus TaxID=2184758 RepID=A0A3E1R7L9_9BURK|nr:ATP-binding protein [Rhodoferax lacus]RFO95356.1 two-component sensor histidine kinase [Rhodoferax lacus]